MSALRHPALGMVPGPYEMRKQPRTLTVQSNLTISHAKTNATLAVLVVGNGHEAATGALFAAAPEMAEALAAYFREEDFLRQTEMHDNYTDRARARQRQADALKRAREAVAKAGVLP